MLGRKCTKLYKNSPYPPKVGKRTATYARNAGPGGWVHGGRVDLCAGSAASSAGDFPGQLVCSVQSAVSVPKHGAMLPVMWVAVAWLEVC